MTKKSSTKSNKIAWIAAIATITAAIIGITPTLIKSLSKDSNEKKNNTGVVIKNVKDSSIITGNGSVINNEK